VARFLLIFIFSLICSYILTPLIKRVAESMNIGMAYPGERKVHTQPIPQVGGWAIYLTFLLVVLLTLKINQQLLGILLGGSLILILGIIDDLFNLPPKVKLAGQIMASLILLFFGVKISFVTNPLGGMIYLGGWGALVTVLWVVGITNALNLIDGLDGLAAGVSIIAAATFFCLSYLGKPAETILILSLILMGSSLGFLRYNFSPAQVFMGDSGAMFLGFTLSAIAVMGAFKSAATLALLAPILVLGVPILDTAFAIVRRLKNGQPAFQADKEHIHHKLLQLGLSQRQTVLLIYLVSIFLGAIALILSRGGGGVGS